MVFLFSFLYNKNAVIEPPPKAAAEFTAEMQGEVMGIGKISLEKWDLSPITRQTERISLSYFPAHKFNFITPFQGARRVHGHSVGTTCPFCVSAASAFREGVSAECIAMKPGIALVKKRARRRSGKRNAAPVF